MEINDLAIRANENSRAHGFWDGPDNNNIPTKLALIHSEISEALEEYRNGTPYFYYGENDKPEGLGVELADAVIRIGDLVAELEIDLEICISEKEKYNLNRPKMHGGKRV